VPSIRKAYQQAPGGTSQNTQLPPINRAYGSHLKRVFYSLFNATESTVGQFLDNSNNTSTSSNAGARVITFQTLWDGIPRQQRYIGASPMFYAGGAGQISTNGSNGDWARQFKFLQDSCYINSDVLGHSWTFCDDFSMRQPRLEKEIKDEEQNKIDGMYIGDADHTWQFQSTNAAGNYNHYAYVQGIKIMRVSPGVLQLV